MDGYIKLYRKSIENGWLKNGDLWRFWCYCLLKATHKKTVRMVGWQQVEIEPGQFIFGRHVASKEIGMSEQTIRTCIKNLENLKNLTIKSTNKYSIITIINWDSYQSQEIEINQQTNQSLTSIQPASNQHLTTDKNIRTKEHKNKTINNKILYLDFVYLAEEEHQKLIAQFGDQGTKERIDRLNVYLGSTGKKYKSHYYTLLNWERRNGDGVFRGYSSKGSNEIVGSQQTGKYAGIETVFEEEG